jgi:hypothetical protein
MCHSTERATFDGRDWAVGRGRRTVVRKWPTGWPNEWAMSGLFLISV